MSRPLTKVAADQAAAAASPSACASQQPVNVQIDQEAVFEAVDATG